MKRLWHFLLSFVFIFCLLPLGLPTQSILADPALLTVNTDAASAITTESGTLNGTIVDTGGENCDIRGFDYGLTADYGSEATETGSFDVGAFALAVSGLSPETTYYFRAKAHNSAGWSYGADMQFTTAAPTSPPPTPVVQVPTVSTDAATSVAADSFTLNGSITATGGEVTDIRGFDYGLTADYGLEVNESGSFDIGAFNHMLVGMSPDTTYHFRAKAHNSAGWSYGADVQVTTSPSAIPVALASVSTESVAKVGADVATLRGNIIDTGGENCDLVGFEYGLTDSYGFNVLQSGSFSTGTFSQKISGLTPGTTYHFRARAHNSAGWSYGNDLQFSTGGILGATRATLTVTLRPNAAGEVITGASALQLGGTTPAATNWQSVDEATANDTVDYVYDTNHNTWTYGDLYNLEDTALSGPISSVVVWMRVRALVTPIQTCAETYIKTNGVEYAGTQVQPADTSWTEFSTTYSTNPQTGVAWTWTEINALQTGVVLRQPKTTGGSREAGCTQVWVVVTYDSPEISNTPDSYNFGTTDEGGTYATGLTYFTVTNNSVFTINISISATNMTGGVTWTLSATATPGTDTYGIKAGLEGGSYDVVVTTSGATLKSGLASSGTQGWGLQFLAPTSMSDIGAKTGTVTLTATQA